MKFKKLSQNCYFLLHKKGSLLQKLSYGKENNAKHVQSGVLVTIELECDVIICDKNRYHAEA